MNHYTIRVPFVVDDDEYHILIPPAAYNACWIFNGLFQWQHFQRKLGLPVPLKVSSPPVFPITVNGTTMRSVILAPNQSSHPDSSLSFQCHFLSIARFSHPVMSLASPYHMSIVPQPLSLACPPVMTPDFYRLCAFTLTPLNDTKLGSLLLSVVSCSFWCKCFGGYVFYFFLFVWLSFF